MYAGFTAHYGPEQETFTAIGTLTFKHTYVYVCVCVCVSVCVCAGREFCCLSVCRSILLSDSFYSLPDD